MLTIERPVIPFRRPQINTRRKPTPVGYDRWFEGTLPNRWTTPAHLQQINEHLQAVERGEIDRLAIHMPPRHGKTETVSVRYPLRFIENNPTGSVLVTGYNERFARRISRKIRTLAAERGLVTDDKSATDEWETKRGGLVMARGVGSPPTGTGFGLIVIDDPVRRREDADSEVYREKVWDWYTDDLYTRLEPGAPIILVMTLWHEDDLGARAVASEPGRWTVLKLPAINEAGEALWPERFPVAALNRTRDVMATTVGSRSWDAIYQQHPTPKQGSTFKVGKLDYVDAEDVPALTARCRAWDLGATEGAGDFTVGAKLGRDEEGLTYVLDVRRGQWDSAERNRRMREAAKADGAQTPIRLPQDPGQAGKDQRGNLTRMLAGYTVKALPVSGDKETRADPFASQVNEGNVRLVRGDWNHAFVEELRAFPAGKHDDQVDAASDAFNEVSVPPVDHSRGAFG